MQLSDKMQLALTGLSFLVALIALIFSFLSFRRSHKTSMQPVLIFSNDPYDAGNLTTWYVENVGNGPAINVVLCGGSRIDSLDSDEAVIIPAMAKGVKERLNFIHHRNYFLATYCDVLGGMYTSTCTFNKNVFTEKNLFPKIIPSRCLYEVRMNERKRNQRHQQDAGEDRTI